MNNRQHSFISMISMQNAPQTIKSYLKFNDTLQLSDYTHVRMNFKDLLVQCQQQDGNESQRRNQLW